MLESFLAATKAVAQQVQTHLAEQAPALAQELDLPQRQRFLELLARGFETFVHGLGRVTVAGEAPAAEAPSAIVLGPQPAGSPRASPTASPTAAASGAGAASAAAEDEATAAARAADDEAFARKFAQLFLDMGGIFPKLAQVLSMRPDIIKNERVLLRLRAVQEECKRMSFEDARALVCTESTAFREGRYVLQDWPRFVHAGSIAQVAPFTEASSSTAAEAAGSAADSGAGEGGEGIPDGIVKMTFVQMREVMEIDFRLLRFQLQMMEHTGQLTGAAGLQALRPKHLGKLKEVWKLMVEMEHEILGEFDLSIEADCQQRGQFVLEGLLGEDGDCPWLEEWQDGALANTLRPAGSSVAGQAVASWRAAGVAASKSEAAPRAGLLSRVARRAFGGRALAASLAEGEEHVGRLRAALRRLRVRVPAVFPEASGPHVLAMAMAEGRSLKEVLDVVAQSPKEEAEKAAAWFAALLLFVIVPLWGKMLLVVGCCHADPHPGNFKVDGIPGLEEVMLQSSAAAATAAAAAAASPKRGFLSRITGRGGAAATVAKEEGPEPPLTLSILDWGSCVDLDDGLRQTLCRLLVSLSAMRVAERQVKEAPDDGAARASLSEATAGAAACVRCLGVTAPEGPGQDHFLAALGMALFDPSVISSHPELRGGKAEQLSRSFPAGSGVGKILRVVAILVGICREMEKRLNDEAAGRLEAAGRSQAGAAAGDRPCVELFLVDLWRPFAEEGLA